MQVSLPSGVCQTLEKMGATMVLSDSGFDMAWGYMAYCCNLDVDWLQCTSSSSTHDFSVGEASEVPTRSASLTCPRNAGVEPVGDRNLLALAVLFLLVGLTPSLTIQACVRRWLC